MLLNKSNEKNLYYIRNVTFYKNIVNNNFINYLGNYKQMTGYKKIVRKYCDTAFLSLP